MKRFPLQLRLRLQSASRNPHVIAPALLVIAVGFFLYLGGGVGGGEADSGDGGGGGGGNEEPTKELTAGWREACGGHAQVYLYAAYLDRRHAGQPTVRIVGIARRHVTQTVECSYWSKNNKQILTVKGKLQIIPPQSKYLYNLAFINCPLPVSHEDNPVTHVSIGIKIGTSRSCGTSLPVQDLQRRNKVEDLNVCVRSLHYEYNRAVSLVEFIEAYKILGAGHFMFYNHSIGGDVEKVLNHYIKEGTVEVLPWNIPAKTDVEIHMDGEASCLNDCVLRSVGAYPLAAMVDLDEYLIPRRHPTLVQLVEDLEHSPAYLFKNAFFYQDWKNEMSKLDRKQSHKSQDGSKKNPSTQHETNVKHANKFIINDETYGKISNHTLMTDTNDETPSADQQLQNSKATQNITNTHYSTIPSKTQPLKKHQNDHTFIQEIQEAIIEKQNTKRNQTIEDLNLKVTQPHLMLQQDTRRLKRLYNYGDRSKYIARTDQVIVAGIHIVLEHSGRRGVTNVEERYGLSHHYRLECVIEDLRCRTLPSMEDTAAHKFLPRLLPSVKKTCRELFPSQPNCPPLLPFKAHPYREPPPE